jgi:hypothetical protein
MVPEESFSVTVNSVRLGMVFAMGKLTVPKDDGLEVPAEDRRVDRPGAVRREIRALGVEFQNVVFGGPRQVVISGNRGTGRTGRGAGGRRGQYRGGSENACERSPSGPVSGVFKVRSIVGVLLAGVGLVLARTVVVYCWRVATAGSSARRRGSASRRMRWN